MTGNEKRIQTWKKNPKLIEDAVFYGRVGGIIKRRSKWDNPDYKEVHWKKMEKHKNWRQNLTKVDSSGNN